MNALNAYIFGGRGKVEILSLSGSSYKFSYAYADRAEDFDNFPLFVYYIDEDDHNREVYVGMVTNDTLRYTKSSRFAPESNIFKAAMAIDNARKSITSFEKCKNYIYHLGACCYCGNELITTEDVCCGHHATCQNGADAPNDNEEFDGYNEHIRCNRWTENCKN